MIFFLNSVINFNKQEISGIFPSFDELAKQPNKIKAVVTNLYDNLIDIVTKYELIIILLFSHPLLITVTSFFGSTVALAVRERRIGQGITDQKVLGVVIFLRIETNGN